MAGYSSMRSDAIREIAGAWQAVSQGVQSEGQALDDATVDGLVGARFAAISSQLSDECQVQLSAATLLRDVMCASLVSWTIQQFREVLDEPTISDADNFYDYGGNSLQALWICVRVEECFGVVISPVDLLEFETVGGFARHVSTEVGRMNGEPLP